MEDLVLLRELIRSPETNCFSLSINRVFAHMCLEELLECVITRAAPPCNPVVTALCFNLLGVKSTNACTRAIKGVLGFAKFYTRRLSTLLRIDVAPASFAPFKNGMERTFVRARQTSTKLKVPDRGCGNDRATRQASLIHRDVHARKSRQSAGTSSVRGVKPYSKSSRSPRVRREVNYNTATSSQSSVVICLDGEPPARNHTVCESQSDRQYVISKIFLRQTGGRTKLPCQLI